jgi:PKD repeat protein
VTFNAAGSGEAGGGTITRYDWNFGDGTPIQTFNQAPPPTTNHTYGIAGTFHAQLTVTDDLGVQATKTVDVTARNLVPTVALTAAANPVNVGAPVTLTAVGASDPDGTIVGYLWDVGGNGTWDSSVPDPSPTHTVSYPNAGTIPVRVGAVDNDGGIGVATTVVTVSFPGGGNGTIDGGGALGLGAPGTATGPGAGGGRGGVSFTARLGGTPFQMLKIVRRRGVSFTCSASHAATCSVSVWLAAKDARALRVNRKAKRPIVVAAFRADIAAGKTVGFTLKASGKLKRALARTRKLALTIQGVATEKGSARRLSLSRVIILRR